MRHLLSLITAALASFHQALERALDYMFALVAGVSPPSFTFTGPVLALNISGNPLDASLLTQLRHESRTSRIGSPRHT